MAGALEILHRATGLGRPSLSSRGADRGCGKFPSSCGNYKNPHCRRGGSAAAGPARDLGVRDGDSHPCAWSGRKRVRRVRTGAPGILVASFDARRRRANPGRQRSTAPRPDGCRDRVVVTHRGVFRRRGALDGHRLRARGIGARRFPARGKPAEPASGHASRDAHHEPAERRIVEASRSAGLSSGFFFMDQSHPPAGTAQ